MLRILINIFLAGITFFSLSAQPVDLRFIDFPFNPDLTNTYVTAITQDIYGFIWIGTTDGLNRFDGYSVKQYKHSIVNPVTLPESQIYKLYNDLNGTLWISQNSSLCQYDFENDAFITVNEKNGFTGLKTYFITHYETSPAGILYVSDLNTVYRYSKTAKKFHALATIVKGEISSFVFDDKENIWIACLKEGGLIRYNMKTREYKQYKYIEKVNSLGKNNISDLQLYKGKLWIATSGAGVNSFDPATGKFKLYPVENDYACYTHNLFVDLDNNLWVVDLTGLKLYIPEQDLFAGYYPDNTHLFTLPPYINGIFQDKQGNFWTTHYPGGVGFCPKPRGFTRFDSKTNSVFHLSVNNVSAICEDSDGNLWMGNPFNGINIFYWSQGKTVVHTFNSSNKHGLSKGAINTLFNSANHKIWIGSHMGGLQYYNPKTNDFTSFVHDPEDNTSVAGNDIRSITEDRYGNLWVCVHGKGIDRFVIAKKQFEHFNKEINGLSNDYTFDILSDDENNTWVATAWGLSVLEENRQTFKTFHADNTNIHSLTSDAVTSVFQDYLGRVWIGTQNGLNLYIKDKDHFKQYIKGFNSNNIYAIVDDKDGNIWVSTLKGISRLKPETGEVINLDKDDGLITDQYSYGAVYKNGMNTLFFGGKDGLNYFNPDKLYFNTIAPSVYITGIKLFNKEITNHDSKFLQKQILATKKVVLDHKQKVITFEYAALNYNRSEKNVYAYYLQGFETDWNYVNNKREATYTNLNPGKYIFRVKAANNDGVWNEKGVSLQLTILPTWWQTLIFKVVVLFIILTVIFIIFRLRFSILQKQKIVLSEKVRIHTNELYELNTILEEKQEEISAQNDELLKHRNNLEQLIIERTSELEAAKIKAEASDKLKTAFLANISHEIRTPMNAIVGFTSLLRKKKLNETKKQHFIDLININVESLLCLIDDILDISLIESDQLVLMEGNIYVNKLLTELEKAFKQKDKKNLHIQFVNDSKEELIIINDPIRFIQIFKNLIDNALKYTDYGEITFGYEVLKRDIRFFVKDTGIGIEETDTENIFSHFYKIEKGKSRLYRGTGIGLSICRQLTEMMGGKMWVKSLINKGSTFYFTLPLIKAEYSPDAEELTGQKINITNLKKAQILIAEDESANYELFENILEPYGAKLIWMKDGREAVDFIKEHPAIENCIILMDLKMPVMDGYEANREIKKINRSIPVIAVTAYAQAKDEQIIINEEFEGYISKPLKEESLLTMISKFFM